MQRQGKWVGIVKVSSLKSERLQCHRYSHTQCVAFEKAKRTRRSDRSSCITTSHQAAYCLSIIVAQIWHFRHMSACSLPVPSRIQQSCVS